MAKLIEIKSISDDRGRLCVIESQKEIPFDIKRVFYIYDIGKNSIRGGHRHKKTKLALICLHGSCMISNDNGESEADYFLDSPTKCLLLNPEDFHTMHDFNKGTVLLSIASEHYDPDDYIYEAYR